MSPEDYHRRLGELLGVRAHLDGCPGEDDSSHVRVEAFERERAVIEGGPDGVARVVGYVPVTVVRCITCGGQREYDRSLEDAVSGVTR